LSIGIVSFALISIVALLTMGMKPNQVSSNEVQASCILSAVEADVRNTYPSVNSGKSKIFELPGPYSVDAAGVVTLNTGLTLNGINSIGINQKGEIVPTTTVPPPTYQVTLLYIKVPAANTYGPTQARLIVNWPCINATSPSQLTSSALNGFVETYITFPAP
jgi:type II secretory pathway pseudopilin PulG